MGLRQFSDCRKNNSYAIQTGQRPEGMQLQWNDSGVDKGKEIAGYRKQLDKIWISFDWSHFVPFKSGYYKHAQWIFYSII